LTWVKRILWPRRTWVTIRAMKTLAAALALLAAMGASAQGYPAQPPVIQMTRVNQR